MFVPEHPPPPEWPEKLAAKLQGVTESNGIIQDNWDRKTPQMASSVAQIDRSSTCSVYCPSLEFSIVYYRRMRDFIYARDIF